MNLADHIDLYCERTSTGLTAEPLNTLSNLAFLIAALLLWRAAQRAGPVRGKMRVLALLVGLVGICSGLFHLTGTVGGKWADALSIALFILAWLHTYLRHLAGWPAMAAAAAIPAYLLANRALAALGPLGLNGSEPYLLPGGLLLILTLWASRHSPATQRWLGLASVCFAVALFLRTMDQAWCEAWPLGTHPAWHVLTALVLYACVRALGARGR